MKQQAVTRTCRTCNWFRHRRRKCGHHEAHIGKFIVCDYWELSKPECAQCEFHFDPISGSSECRINPPTHDGFPKTPTRGACGQFQRLKIYLCLDQNTPLVKESVYRTEKQILDASNKYEKVLKKSRKKTDKND